MCVVLGWLDFFFSEAEHWIQIQSLTGTVTSMTSLMVTNWKVLLAFSSGCCICLHSLLGCSIAFSQFY